MGGRAGPQKARVRLVQVLHVGHLEGNFERDLFTSSLSEMSLSPFQNLISCLHFLVSSLFFNLGFHQLAAVHGTTGAREGQVGSADAGAKRRSDMYESIRIPSEDI